MTKYIGAIDQGTTSTRFMIFEQTGQVIAIDQKEHEQIFPKPGWVEHNPLEIWTRVQEVIAGALHKANLTAFDLAAIGIDDAPLSGGIGGGARLPCPAHEENAGARNWLARYGVHHRAIDRAHQ